jgi:1,4-alpha-glucan branching enzyme
MICKSFINVDGGVVARVTFQLPNSVWADCIYLVGDFNGWSRKANPLKRDQHGNWHITLDLETDRVYQFRYLCDNTHWINDSEADAYIPNLYNTDNFVVVTDPDFRRYHGEGMG